MSARLLERDAFLEDLAGLLNQAASGSGRCELVSGEAGIGKSALLERFAELHGDSARFCWGRCEALFTPRPLGPLHDIASQLQGRTRDLLEHDASRPAVFAAFLEELGAGPRPTVAIIEDVHWADEATFDLLKFLGRRVHHLPVLLIITYRDEEVGHDHPLWFALGDVPSSTTRRLHLPPLSRDAVAALARDTPHTRHDLYTVTEGNPFFVTELLASADAEVPETVRAAVLARIARLSPQAHAVLELASVVPARTELWVLNTLLPRPASAIEECMQAGVLRMEPTSSVAFRHELARQAVETTLSPLRRKQLHAEVLRLLLATAADPSVVARLVHHAALADDGAAVLRFAPEAAQQAAKQGAHREAAMHYATALRYADQLLPAQRAELLESRAYECYLTSQPEDAAQARAAALAVWTELGAGDNIGRNLRWLSRLNWFLGDKAAAEHYAAKAVAVLEVLPPSSELAMAYSNVAQLRMLEDDTAGAVQWGMRALELAEMLGDDEIRVHALNNVGTAQFNNGAEDGRARLGQSLHLALERGFEEHVARAYTNLGSTAVMFRQYARASQDLDDGISYCAERDLDSWRLYMTSWRARARFELGDWTRAADDAAAVLAGYRVSPVIRIQALVVLAWVRMRRGDPGVQPILDEAWDLAQKTGEPQRIVPVAAARAEAAWLRGDLATCRSEARTGYKLASEHTGFWDTGRLFYWLWKTGDRFEMPSWLPEPYVLHCSGDWRSAAVAWERLGCPYEQALALAEGDARARRAAFADLDRLGARATSERLKLRWGADRLHVIPRGPRPSTRTNPAGLTNQQLEVLRLMATGLHNLGIAETLQVSPKTVEHHVSAVLAKLSARSRTQAVAQAYTLGVLPNMGVVAKIGGREQPR